MAARAKTERRAYPLRMPPDLYAKLAAIAKREARTMNQQIVYFLSQAVTDRPSGR